jgi:transposase
MDVPAKLAARVRLLSTGHGRKNDDADATSVGIAALTATGLPTFAPNETTIALRALVEHRDDLVKTRTQTLNRLHELLTQPIPGGAPTRLAADTAAQLLRTVRPRTPLLATLRALASDLIAEIRRLDRRIAATATEITTAVQASGTSLTQLHGIGNLLAAKILARVGDISRFRSAAAFASYTAPRRSRCPPVTSCATGCPAPETANSISACTSWLSPKSAMTPPATPTTSANAPPGKSSGSPALPKTTALRRCYRRLLRDAQPNVETGPGGHQGATPISSAAGSTPTTDSSDKSLPEPVGTDSINTTPRST